jgi:hypothetical protein
VGGRDCGSLRHGPFPSGNWERMEIDAGANRSASTGVRNQVVSLVAAGIEANLFSELVVQEGMRSLGYLLDAPVAFEDAPEPFCLDLYKAFDLDRLALIAAPTKVVVEQHLKTHSKN